jgi:hypothetical protein
MSEDYMHIMNMSSPDLSQISYLKNIGWKGRGWIDWVYMRRRFYA